MATNREIIEAHYAASARGDLDGMLADFADDMSWTEMAGFPYAGTYVGLDEIREQVFGRLGADWDGFDATPEQVIDGGDGNVVTLGLYTGTYRATGKSMTVRFAHFWQVRDGRIVRFEQVTDSHLVRQAMR
ncbi:nuclear transport factor 2 family protein [Sphaerimonospora cavernae]|uniref:Nuclear transport factor 2 family protein n=1 Tax=Sphaerimonospora cavernae TaxID=1740611 RepID=A0ABV6U9F3_9ACTN